MNSALTIVSIACNSHENGAFRGRADSIHYGDDQDLELQHQDWYRGVKVTFLKDGRVRIGRRTFVYERHKEWYGNWCWDGFWMKRKEARRLLRYLHDSGRWHCEAGPCRLYDWFNRPASS
jgi:hypothetical protein